MNVLPWIAGPGARSVDFEEVREVEEPAELEADEPDLQAACELMARKLGSATFEAELLDRASNAFARRILGCDSIDQAKAEANAWLGIKAPF